MAFKNLIQITPIDTVEKKTTVSKPRVDLRRGCDFCPLNAKEYVKAGLNKIKGKVKGKKIFIWAQSPGPQENKQQKELVGPSGEFLWGELKRVGISRKDCDIQNVVRCMPCDLQKAIWPPFKMRAPNKEEIKACSKYTDRAVEKSKAKIHLVFGQVAAGALLGKDLKKDDRVYYSEKLRGWVVYLDHPSFFIRQGYGRGSKQAPNIYLKRFREDLIKASRIIKHGGFDRYSYLKKQHYIGVVDRYEAEQIFNKLKYKAIREGKTIVADMEEGKVNKHGEPDEKGKSVALVCGFAYKPKTSYVFALDMPKSGASTKDKEANKYFVKRLLNDKRIPIVFHYGVSDADAVVRLLGTKVRGYKYDTLLGEYFRDPNIKQYGLTVIADRRFPKFTDYKSIEGPEGFTPEFKKLMADKKYAKLSLPAQVKLARTKGGLNLARMSFPNMVLYNGADCHVTKLIELSTTKYVNPPLMQVYIDSGFVLKRMEREQACKPLFDYQWHTKISEIFKIRIAKLEKAIKKLSGKYAYIPHQKTGEIRKLKFKPNSPNHIKWLIYTKLKCKYDGDDKPNTRASTLRQLALKNKKVAYITAYRVVTKAKNTYLKGYLKCAELNEGHLRTNWKQTGTSTGRMSSGRTKDKKNEAVINFQNIHGDPLIQCLLISSRKWRKLYRHWRKHGDFDKHTWKKFRKIHVDLGFDFSQNELRELAEESGDKALIKAFSRGKPWYCKKCKKDHPYDPHVEVGHSLTGWAKEKIAHDDRIRKLIKNMQFGLVYGLQGEGLYLFLRGFGVETTLEEVNFFHKKYFKKYPGVKKLQDKLRKYTKKHGHTKNRFGFRRPINVNQQEEMGSDYEGAFWGNQAINCVDFKTEALTQRGWVKGYSLNAGDVLLTYNSERKIMEWQSAIDIKVFPNYKGKVHRLTSKSFSAVTTPDHRWVRCNGKEFVSNKIPEGASIPRVMPYIGPSKSHYSDDFIRLIGWVLTDGSYGRRLGKDKGLGALDQNFTAIDQRGKGWANQGVYVCQSKPKNVFRIDKLFRRLSIEMNMPYRTKALKNRSKHKEIFWSFSGQYGRWFKGMFPDRELTTEFLVQLPKRQLEILLRTMLRGDGFLCRTKRGIDSYQILAYLCGKAATVRYRDMSMYTPISDKLSNIPNMTGIWGGKILKRENISMSWVKQKVATEQIGMWCPIVPNTFFVARRKGTVYITGNTPIQGGAHLYLSMSIAALHRYPKRYKLLKNPNKEIHDALYFRIMLINLFKGAKLGYNLMVKEPEKIVKKDFKLRKRVPLSAKPKAGFRFGVQVEGIGTDIKNEWEFLNAWCRENKQLEDDYKRQLIQHNLKEIVKTVLYK